MYCDHPHNVTTQTMYCDLLDILYQDMHSLKTCEATPEASFQLLLALEGFSCRVWVCQHLCLVSSSA